MRAALLVLVAACGASPPGSAPRPTTASGTIELLEQVAERACACTDFACADTVATDLETRLAGLPTFLDDPAFARADAAIQRGIGCLWKHEVVGYGYGEISRSAKIVVRDETCACRDVACLDGLGTGRGMRTMRLQATPNSPERDAEIDVIEQASETCANAVVDALAYVQEIVAFRDRACACALGDRACGDVITVELAAWAKRHETATTTWRERSRLMEHAAEIQTCLVKSGWTPP